MKTLQKVEEALSSLEKGSVIFLDVDDTLITPCSKLFSSLSPDKNFIDDLKKNRENIPNFDLILSHWRLQRKTMLVAEGWPQLIRRLKAKYPVYALTKMDTGSFGDIPSMEKWRYDELTNKDILFTPSFNGVFEQGISYNGQSSSPASFYHGIFITGSFTKGDVVSAFVEASEASTLKSIVLIDDREDHLHDVEKTCLAHNIPFLGILFKGMDLIKGAPDPAVSTLQKHHLLTYAEWLEDDVAAEMIKRTR